MRTYLQQIEELQKSHPELARELSSYTNLEKILRFLEEKQFALAQMDVVAQDEFSHDVIIPFHGSEGMFLVFGVT